MIIQFSDLKQLRQKHIDKRIVLAGGSFDIVHRGHISYLQLLRTFGDTVVIAVSGDKRVRERKGASRPINNQDGRLRVVDAIKFVDYSLIAPDPDGGPLPPTTRIIQELKPDCFITLDKRWLDYEAAISAAGTELIIPNHPKEDSTTAIIKRAADSIRQP